MVCHFGSSDETCKGIKSTDNLIIVFDDGGLDQLMIHHAITYGIQFA